MNLDEYQNPDVIRGVLDRKTVAVVGLSANELRASNFVGRYLQIRRLQRNPGQSARVQHTGHQILPFTI